MPLSNGPSNGLSNDAAQHRALKQAVFLHTGWRSAGTWVWSRLRELDTVTAFYEPLSNVLAELSLADVSASRPTLTSGHPPLAAPYFEEYRPFLQEGVRGVAGYQRRFSLDRFAKVPDAEFPQLQAYLRNLCERTAAQGSVPVFKFCRSSGRLPWLRAAFPQAMHVGVLRNPASQFASGWLLSRQWSNPFFVAAPFRVLGLNQADPLVRQAIDTCGARLPPAAPASEDAYAMACEHYARTAEGNNAYRAFIALWILCALRMADGVDLLIDIDRLGASRDYAQALSTAFETQSGLSPDFSSARDLVEETRGSAARMSGIDGRAMRTVHSAALKFLKAHGGADAAFVEVIRQKMVLANELTDTWR
ncbi:hypothetical protein BCh11DRAFT_01312 [Burkholderia sp. Ch1-1]|uniref:Sulfotransferase family protein n=1 Tax=Paraburkholderia dioscoreae TaxID=2604047 RepID=A0A5Q4YXI2_9BURK|nr:MULTISPECIES: hypothetical protein [Paraburkholderia]EIF33542.1 hypothetical protein BCh11DRAFT_01312 [Burkholderia sp. Ch1-1]MDR8395687.1 hypothetical protein [Paraburkholderia sp. USG1]VVD32402.1 conserved protein of unknown function [Paraburkholderia dioscoreae]